MHNVIVEKGKKRGGGVLLSDANESDGGSLSYDENKTIFTVMSEKGYRLLATRKGTYDVA